MPNGELRRRVLSQDFKKIPDADLGEYKMDIESVNTNIPDATVQSVFNPRSGWRGVWPCCVTEFRDWGQQSEPPAFRLPTASTRRETPNIKP